VSSDYYGGIAGDLADWGDDEHGDDIESPEEYAAAPEPPF
jgi:hypothetical protein